MNRILPGTPQFFANCRWLQFPPYCFCIFARPHGSPLWLFSEKFYFVQDFVRCADVGVCLSRISSGRDVKCNEQLVHAPVMQSDDSKPSDSMPGLTRRIEENIQQILKDFAKDGRSCL